MAAKKKTSSKGPAKKKGTVKTSTKKKTGKKAGKELDLEMEPYQGDCGSIFTPHGAYEKGGKKGRK